MIFSANDQSATWWPSTYDGTPITGGFTVTGDTSGTSLHEGFFGLDAIRRRLTNGREWLRRALGTTLTQAASSTPIEYDLWVELQLPIGSRFLNDASQIKFTVAYVFGAAPQLSEVQFPMGVPALQMLATPYTFLKATTQDGLNAAPMESDVGNPAIDAYRRLCQLLPMDAAAVAKFIGVRRTTPYKWIRENASPRSGTERDVLSLDSAIRPLMNLWGTKRTRAWLGTGEPAPIEHLRSRNFELFEAAVQGALQSRKLADAESIASEFGAVLPVRRGTSRGVVAKLALRRRPTMDHRADALAGISSRAEGEVLAEPFPEDSTYAIGVIAIV